MIKFDSVSVVAGEKEIVKNINLSLSSGERILLSGPSGSGKSTILKTVVGMILPVKGSVYVNSFSVNPENMVKIRELICYVPQSIFFPGDESAERFLLFPFTFRMNRHIKPDSDYIYEMMDRFSLSRDLLKSPMKLLSGGERQRIALIRAFLLKRKIYLLDEVTSAMDRDNRMRVMDYIDSIKDMTVIAVSHDPEWSERIPRRIVIEKGEIAGGENGQR